MIDPGFMSGYKTYITAGVGILLTWAAFALGEPIAGQEVLSLTETLMATFGGILAMTIRHGVRSDKVQITVVGDLEKEDE